MGKRGSKPKRESITWSSEIAYAVGLLVTDGSLSIDGRHIDLTSKDVEQLENFMKCIGVNVKIGTKKSEKTESVVHRVQFGDVTLYNFLLSIGLTPNKTKTLGAVKVPKKYFFDFLRGLHDGDGCFYSYQDLRWKNSLMFYLVFASASQAHIFWLQKTLEKYLGVNGHITKGKGVLQLKYAKSESKKIIAKMYHRSDVVALSRKRLKIKEVLGILSPQDNS
jgi:hypothetical protein